MEEENGSGEEIETFPLSDTFLDKFYLLHLSNENNQNYQEIVDSFSDMLSIEDIITEDNKPEHQQIIEDLLELLDKDLVQMTKAELSDLCKSLGLAYSGNKATLKNRILNYHAKELEFESPPDDFQFKPRNRVP